MRTRTALGLQPSFSRAKNELIDAGGVGGARRQRTGVWLLSTETVLDSTSLERHLAYLLDTVEPARGAIDSIRSAGSTRADFFCCWVSATGHGGPELSAETLARVAALDASVGIDFYGPEHEPG